MNDAYLSGRAAHALDGARLRLDRARFHMDELDVAFRSYLADHWETSLHPEVPEAPWNFRFTREPPHYFGVIIGEAVQNLRSALDYLVYELAIHDRGGSKPRTRTQFPICTTPGNFFRGREYIRPLLGEHRRRIRKLQPYQSKDPAAHPLAILNRLSNTDKHRLLLTVFNELGGVPDARIDVRTNTYQGTKAAVAASYLRGTEPIEDLKRRDPDLGLILYVDLAFGVGNQPVFDTLKRLLWTVTETVDSFAPIF
jgi:hypothetical protein